ncbi:FAD-binding oxidoreductase [Chloroflexi bacterium TSY]|nr:FAD-binding oxidoreductase [Chloroflexi bacterium TSY]
MSSLPSSLIDQLNEIVGPENVSTDAKYIDKNSRDCYWYSPVLKPKLDDKVPVTLRGAGTGNYGQGVPMQGGILISTRRMVRILELTPAFARVEAGVVLIDIEKEAQQIGAELRFFPSTVLTATAGGFLAGGSGGVGSITWGTLWDEGNVLGVTVVTIEEEPQILTLTAPDEMQGVIHNCGLTCIIVDLTFALAPVQPWEQYVVAFDTFDAALRFGENLAYDESIPRRLITPLEWPVPSFFRQLVRDGACPDGKSIVLLQLVMEWSQLEERLAPFGGSITWYSPHEKYQKEGWQLVDFSWNHTTLWAMKHDDSFTYLQDLYDPEQVHQQWRLLKERYGDDILGHFEFFKFQNHVVPGGLSIVRFYSKKQLWSLIDYCESIGVVIANPHTHRLDEDWRWNGQPILDAKARWDPYSLLNPGHLKVLETSSTRESDL